MWISNGWMLAAPWPGVPSTLSVTSSSLLPKHYTVTKGSRACI